MLNHTQSLAVSTSLSSATKQLVIQQQ